MSKLTFRYATMKSGKSAEAIQIVNNYLYGNKIGCILVPSVDTDAAGSIKTRFGGGVEVKAKTFTPRTNIHKYVKSLLKEQRIDFIVIDEANFLTPEQVDQLGDIVDYEEINVLAYGLTTKFDGTLFDGSKRLMEIADYIEPITVRSICHCGKKAIFNARIVDGVIVKEGKDIVIDNKDGKRHTIEYVPLCRKCFKENKLKEGD